MSDPYGPPPGYGYGQQPPAGHGGPGGPVSQDDKTWALIAHLGSLVAAWVALGFIAPLLVMLVKGDSPYVRRHAVESLNFQISLLIYSIVAVVVGAIFVVMTFGLGALIVVPLYLVALLVVLILVIKATMRASNGEDYRYPFTLRLVS